jgi:hypothetical protein
VRVDDIDRLTLLMEKRCIFLKERTQFLNLIHMNFDLKGQSFGFHKRRVIYLLTQRLSAPQGLCYMEFISSILVSVKIVSIRNVLERHISGELFMILKRKTIVVIRFQFVGSTEV